MKTALADTADAVGDTMALLRPATEKLLLTSLESTIDDLEGLTTDEYMDTLVDILGGDPAVYGQYFPEMVQTSVNEVYPIANYGSAMTPFYTVLAIWVGGVISSSLIKIHARTEGLIDPKPAELYFGRYLFFFVLSQIEAAVIVTGDLYILKVQCLHPGMLYLTGALTAFTFSLLIYSLALSFGDVGKAIVVVIMVMQIAGSSGTFPIELLPAIYQKISSLLPLPLCHRRYARVHLRDVRELILAADRLPAAVRRGGAADRPAGAAALHGTEPLYGGEAGGDGAAVKGGVDR